MRRFFFYKMILKYNISLFFMVEINETFQIYQGICDVSHLSISGNDSSKGHETVLLAM